MGQRKLGRTSGHRHATFRSMVTALVLHDRIRTTEAKAKEIRSIAEKLISLAGREDLHSRRLVASYIASKDALKKLFSDIGPRYKDKPGGYTRIIKLEARRGDRAPLVIVELV
ncbi:MAG TPA: 50S ribosomal protein L17 [Firmicutes bacterium]|nr:50S ribosomal protein L17 [Bacillota bacterium]